jgi:hypothetical protein
MTTDTNSFADARIRFAASINGADGKQYYLIAITRADGSDLFGGYKFAWLENQTDFHVDIKSFGYVNNHHVGNPKRRLAFTSEECLAVEQLIRSFFSDPEVFKKGFNLGGNYLGNITFQPDWIIRTDGNSFEDARIWFAGVLNGRDEKVHYLIAVVRADGSELFGGYKHAWLKNGNDFNVEIEPFGYVDRHDVGATKRRLAFTAEECSAVAQLIWSFFSDPEVFKKGYDVGGNYLGNIACQPDWIIQQQVLVSPEFNPSDKGAEDPR